MSKSRLGRELLEWGGRQLGSLGRGTTRGAARGADDAARAGGRFLPRAGAGAALGAGAMGAAWLANQVMGGLGNQGADGSAAGGPAMAGGGGLSGSRAGMASSRGFTAPALDNSIQRVSYNANADPAREMVRISAISANTLASIDKVLKNTLKFETAKALWETKSLRELAIESSNPTNRSGGAGGGGVGGGYGLGAAGGASGRLTLGLIGAIGAVAALAYSTRDSIENFLSGAGGGGSGGAPGGAQGFIDRQIDRAQDYVAQMADPSSGPGRALEGAGDGLLASSTAGDARRYIARGAPTAGATRLPVPANDNTVRAGGRMGGIIARASSAGRRIAGFFRALRATPLGRLPIMTPIFAAIDPAIAIYEAHELGGNDAAANENIRRQFVGAIGMILGSGLGVVAGAAIGTAVGSVIPVAGNIVGFFAGGLLGAVGALGAEFIAEQIFDLVAGNIDGGEFLRNIARAAGDGIGRLGGLALGAVTGAALGGLRGIRGMLFRGGTAVAVGATAGASRPPTPAAGIIGGSDGSSGSGHRKDVLRGSGGHMKDVLRGGGSDIASGLVGEDLIQRARTISEQYLGRRLHNDEWNALIRIVNAESGRGAGGREDAMIAGSVLNRARNPTGYRGDDSPASREYLRRGLTVLAVLYAPSQFQPVTGPTGRGSPHASFLQTPSPSRIEEILRHIVQFLAFVSPQQVNFGSNHPDAYSSTSRDGAAYIAELRSQGYRPTGQSLFNTEMMGGARDLSGPVTGAPTVGAGGVSAGRGGGFLNRMAGALGGLLGRSGGSSGSGYSGSSGGGVIGGGSSGGPGSGSGREGRARDGTPLTRVFTRAGRRGDSSGTALVAAPYRARFQSLINGLESSGYPIHTLYGYANRRIGGSSAWSQHAYGRAIDINPQQNPMGSRRITDMPIPLVQNLIGRLGLGWGYNWRSKSDAMHFSVGGNEGGTIDHSLNNVDSPDFHSHDQFTQSGASGVRAGRPITPDISSMGLLGSGTSMALQGFIAPSVSSGTGDNLGAASLAAAARDRSRPIVIQERPASPGLSSLDQWSQMSGPASMDGTESPVLAQYRYTTHWGVETQSV